MAQLILVYSVLYLLGFLKYRRKINIITIFLIIFYLANHAYYVIYTLGGVVPWRADPSVSYDTIDILARTNSLNLCVFCALILLFHRDRVRFFQEAIPRHKVYFYLYFILSLGVLYASRELLLGFIEYGAKQTKGVEGTFSPLNRIYTFRVFFAIYYLLFSDKKGKKILILISELIMSMILFERKDFSLIFGSYMLHLLISGRLKLGLSKFGAVFPVFLMIIMLPVYRSFGGDDLSVKIMKTVNFFAENTDKLLYLITGLVDSEGVQNWTYQLIQRGTLGLTAGMTYLQGIVNMFVLRPFQPLWLQEYQAAYYFKAVAYPTVTNHGYDFTFTAEAILNWGLNYSWISYALLALIVLRIYNAKDMYVWKITIWPIVLIGMRTDSTTMFRLVSYLIAMELIGIIYNTISKDVRNFRPRR